MLNTSRDDYSEFSEYFKRVQKLMEGIVRSELTSLCRLIKDSKKNKGLIFVVGNGGSSALASHFATDLGSGSILRGQDYPIISLVDNSPVITAAANDFGYDQIFARQIASLGKTNDLLLVISSSGNSRNLIEAIGQAKKIGMKSAAITGFDGGKIRSLVDLNVHVPSEIGEYGQVEDLHSIILHSIAIHLRAGN
jgi:D-sedoheptulose 7-phosphate isomerase